MGSDIRREKDKLKGSVLYLGSAVESNLHKAMKSLQNNNVQLAHEVKQNDIEINSTEVQVEDHCLTLLALHQPVASDLRFLVTVFKINMDLERIGDLVVKIADKVLLISLFNPHGEIFTQDLFQIQEELHKMFISTTWMLKKSLDAFAREDAELAYKVILADDAVDKAKHTIRALLEKTIQEDPAKHVSLAKLLSVSRSLERIADHTTNICEDIIYMLQGRIIRHVLDKTDLAQLQAERGVSR